MKKAFVFLTLCLIIAIQNTKAQNVGINNTSPLTKLDINGDIAFRSADITIATTYTYALDVNTVKQSHYKLKSPTLPIGNFILAGITAGTDGRMITLTNYTGAAMEIYDEDATTNANDRIKTGIGTTLAIYPNGSVLLQYDVPEQRWLVKGGHNNSLSYFGGSSGGTSYWDISGTNIFNNNTGNVGIGTSSPQFKLDVSGNTRLSGTPITVPGFNGTLTSGGSLRIQNSVNNFFLKIDGGIIQSEKANTQSSGSTASVLAINPHGGFVGINTTVASSPLSFPNVLGNKISFWNAAATADYGIGLQSGTLQIYTAGQDQIAFGYGNSANFTKTMTYYPGSAQLGINCLPQVGYQLAVDGKIKAKEIVVELAGWADYVFEEDYKLPSLENVEQHIKANKHLPGIPSAVDIKKQGLSVGAVQTKMMEKIEELTIYLIEANKRIQQLEKANNLQKQ